MDPFTQKSITFAGQLAIPNIKLVVNKVRGEEDRNRVKTYMESSGLKGRATYFLPYTTDLLDLEPAVGSILTREGEFTEGFVGLFEDIRKLISEEPIRPV